MFASSYFKCNTTNIIYLISIHYSNRFIAVHQPGRNIRTKQRYGTTSGYKRHKMPAPIIAFSTHYEQSISYPNTKLPLMFTRSQPSLPPLPYAHTHIHIQTSSQILTMKNYMYIHIQYNMFYIWHYVIIKLILFFYRTSRLYIINYIAMICTSKYFGEIR